MTWRALAVAIAAVLPMIASTPVRAFMIPPPALLQIRFDSVTDELTPGGRVAADRLAVRAARCSDGRLRVLIRHESGTRPAQVTARYGAVRQHLSRLGVDAIYVNRFVGNGEGASASSVWASVSSEDDMHCSQVDSSLLQSWAGQLARHARQAAGGAPPFWSRMTASVRRDELAPILAATSYCAVPDSGMARGPVPRCMPHPMAFDWLAEQAVRQQTGDERSHWLEILWSAADASTLERWQRQLGIAALSPEDVLRWVPALVASDLRWEEVERRLLMPGLMSRVGREALYARFPFAGDVVRGALDRRRLDALPRLIEAAGEQAHGLQWESSSLPRTRVTTPSSSS
jgi:hypothetical protein